MYAYTIPFFVHKVSCVIKTLLCAIGLVCPSLRDSSSKVLKRLNSGIPIDASISDGDALLKTARALGWNLLVTLVDVGLNHDTDNASLAVADLVSNVLCYKGLVAVILV